MSAIQTAIELTWNLTIRAAAVGNALHANPEVIAKLVKTGRQLRRLAVAHCNRGLTGREETKLIRGREVAQELVKPMGATAYYQGDPRGCVLWVVFPADMPEGGNIRSYYTYGVPINL